VGAHNNQPTDGSESNRNSVHGGGSGNGGSGDGGNGTAMAAAQTVAVVTA